MTDEEYKNRQEQILKIVMDGPPGDLRDAINGMFVKLNAIPREPVSLQPKGFVIAGPPMTTEKKTYIMLQGVCQNIANEEREADGQFDDEKIRKMALDQMKRMRIAKTTLVHNFTADYKGI